MKVICAGLPKTGTKTMAEALRILGYNVHDVFHQYFLDIDLWNKVLDNTATPEDYRRALKDVDAVTDFPACGLWEQISEAFPEAKVILMVRSSEDEWFKSMQHHFTYTMKFLPFHGSSKWAALLFDQFFGERRRDFVRYNEAFLPYIIGTMEFQGKANEVMSKSRYRQHNTYVKSVCPTEKLLVFNVKEGWEPLCKFLGKEVPDEPFPMKNVKAEIVKEVSMGRYEHDCGYHKTVIKQACINLFLIITVVVLFFGFVLA